MLDSAAALNPRVLRSLDAIHLAAARLVQPEVDGVVTYDGRMAEAAEWLELVVHSPGLTSSDESPAR